MAEAVKEEASTSEADALSGVNNEEICEENRELFEQGEKLLTELPSPDLETDVEADRDPATPGRVRAASAGTRLFGHFMAEKNPRATWAVGVLRLDKDPGGNVMRDTVWSRIMKYPRFRSQLVVSRMGGYWRELPEQELLEMRDNGYLWSEVCTDGNATDDDVNTVINQTMSWAYDRHKPLWRMQYCRKMADGSAFLLITINHGIGDGISLVAALLAATDDGSQSMAAQPPRKNSRKSSGTKQQTGRPPGPKLNTLTKTRAYSFGVFQGLTSSMWKPDSKNSLCMPDVTKPSTEKRVAKADPIPLDEMKRVKEKFPGATLNDIMMAVMTATIRAYFEEVNDPVLQNKGRVRGAFPINLRNPHEPILRNNDPRNKWSYGNFTFDFQYKNRIELVWKVKKQIDKIKVSPSPLIQYSMMGVLTKSLPRRVLLDTLLNVANMTTAQLSNVPGPQTKVSMAGSSVEDLSFFLFTPVGLYFGIMSYNGEVSAGVNVDGTTSCDPKQLAKHWKMEFDALKAEVDALNVDYVPVPKRW